MELFDIIGYFDLYFSNNFNDKNKWEGQFLLEDNWFEGLVLDSNISKIKKCFIFGVYTPRHIQLFKLSPNGQHTSFVFNATKKGEDFLGGVNAIGEKKDYCFADCNLITRKVVNQEVIQEFHNEIKVWKEKMPEEFKPFYDLTTKIKERIINMINMENETYDESDYLESESEYEEIMRRYGKNKHWF